MNVKSATFLRLYEDKVTRICHVGMLYVFSGYEKAYQANYVILTSVLFFWFFCEIKELFYRNHHSDGLCILVSITMVCQYYLESSSIFIKGFISF